MMTTHRRALLALLVFALVAACSDDQPSGDGPNVGVEAGPADGGLEVSLGDLGSGDLPTSGEGPQPGQKIVFITSARYDGNLGGISGADSKCNQLASAAGLAGSYIAWISDTSSDAITRLQDVGPWVRRDGMPAFANKAALTAFDAGPQNGLWIDEKGTAHGSDRLWTGTGPGGTYVSSIGESCQGWTSASMQHQARIGQAGRTTFEWSSFSFTTCDQDRLRLICFGQ